MLTTANFPPHPNATIKSVITELESRIRAIEERMLILNPPYDAAVQYPALATAYNEYKIIEKLTLGIQDASSE